MGEKLVIGYDGSERADDAVALGRVLAELVRMEPILVSAFDGMHPLIESYGPEGALDKRRGELSAIAEDRFPQLDVGVHAAIGRSAARELTHAAESEDAAAIVIGSAHRGVFGRVAIGSVGSSVIHGAPCAVAVAPQGFAGKDTHAFAEIAVAFDGSPESWAALETGIGLAKRADSNLTVVTVADFPNQGLGSASAILSAEQILDAERREKQRVLELALGRVPDAIPVRGRHLVGSAAQALADISGDFDLMVLGSRGYGPVRRTFLGGVASQLIHTASCAVLVVPRGAGTDPLGVGPRVGGPADPR